MMLTVTVLELARPRSSVTVTRASRSPERAELVVKLARSLGFGIRLMALNTVECPELDFYDDAEMVERVVAAAEGFAAWCRRTRPEWVTGVMAVIDAVVERSGLRFAYETERTLVGRVRSTVLVERQQVLAGLEPGDRVIVSGQHLLADGTAVAVQGR